MTNLSELFKAINDAQAVATKAGEKRNGVANDILASLQDAVTADLNHDVEVMLNSVIDAYIDNSWSMKGVIKSGSPAPKTVQTYTSAIRKAVEKGINPNDYDTWSQFRKATKDPKPATWHDQGDAYLADLDDDVRDRVKAEFEELIQIRIMELSMQKREETKSTVAALVAATA